MDELKLIEDLGVVTSSEVKEILQKGRSVINQLNKLEFLQEIKIIIFHTDKIRRRVYVSNEVYKSLNKIA